MNITTFFTLLKIIVLFEMLASTFTEGLVSATAQQHLQRCKELPEKILVAYTTNKCDTDMQKVTRALDEGINVLIWSFIKFERVAVEETSGRMNEKVEIKTELDITQYRRYRKKLDLMGHKDVVHLAAFGGWNGPHLPSGYAPEELYQAYRTFNTQKEQGHLGGNEPLFDGIDWDLEGHDNTHSPTNEFTKECLDQMGEFSAMAKQDGFIVSMAPPEVCSVTYLLNNVKKILNPHIIQSYLDITSEKFSRYVNLTYPENEEFPYHGQNAYAYILAKWNSSIDFIFIQFYESYSHAAHQIFQVGQNPSDFLIAYVSLLIESQEQFFVRFRDDPTVQLENQFIQLPLSKLVLGFANGWALNDDLREKTVFFPRVSIINAIRHLSSLGKEVRGAGFWVVEEEGAHGVDYTKDLKSIFCDDRVSKQID